MAIQIRNACIGAISMFVALQASAQSVRDAIASAGFGSGYAQLLNLAATPDISSAHYEIPAAPEASIDIVRVPYQSRWLALSHDSDLYWKVAAGYLQWKNDFLLSSMPPTIDGSVSSKWLAYSLTGGLLAKMRIGNGFTLEPAVDVGVARLTNRADYAGAAVMLQPFLDGLLFNWQTNAWLLTPSIGLVWSTTEAVPRISVRGRVARSWISSFDESDPIIKLDETSNVYSIRAERVAPTAIRVLGRPLDWVLYGGYAGFLGSNRRAFGLKSVAELGIGVEAPRSTAPVKSDRVRLGASYLFGSTKGWTVSLGLQY